MAGEVVQPPAFSKPIGRYSPGVRVPLGGGRWLLFVSGQVATDAEGRTVGPGDPGRQTRKVFENLSRVLEEAGGSLGDLVSITIYLTRMADFAAVSAVRNEALAGFAPSSTLVEVKGLAVADHLVEISGVAVIEPAAGPEAGG